MPTISSQKWKDLVERDGDRCHYCRLTTVKDLPHSHPRKATIDHKTPRSRGGGWSLDNLVISCDRCNGEKGDMPYEMYLWYRHMLLRGHDRIELLQAIDIVLAESGDCMLCRLPVDAERTITASS